MSFLQVGEIPLSSLFLQNGHSRVNYYAEDLYHLFVSLSSLYLSGQ